MIKAEQLVDRILADGIEFAPETSDNLYALPTLEWFLNDLTDDIRKVIEFYNLTPEDEAFDCDDFTLLAAVVGRIAHRKTSNHPRAGIALGYVAFKRAINNKRHAVLCCVTAKEVAYMDIWTQKRVWLTSSEKLQCYRCWF